MWFIGKYFSYERAGWIAVAFTVLFLGYLGIKYYGFKQFFIELTSFILFIGVIGVVFFALFFLVSKLFDCI